MLSFAGQQARDALLLIMQLSNRNESIAKYIVENTNFCPVRFEEYHQGEGMCAVLQILATGLSALYSDLPHRLATNNDDWFILTKKEWSESPSLVQFMNSLQFCNDVIQVNRSRKTIISNEIHFFLDRPSDHWSLFITVYLSWISRSCSRSEYSSGMLCYIQLGGMLGLRERSSVLHM